MNNIQELEKTNAGTYQDTLDILHGEDDINKYNKLVAAFREKYRENNGFNDTFIDEEVYMKTMQSEDYLRISVDLLKYIMHTSFNVKKKDDGKKPGVGVGRR